MHLARPRPLSSNGFGAATRRRTSSSSTSASRSTWSGRRRRCTCGSPATGSRRARSPARLPALLTSPKEESELTMCTDVDRNDKSRICLPGSIKVIGRRQIELYSRLIHTVDHVEGRLRPGFDALDAFLTHMWAVTVTG